VTGSTAILFLNNFYLHQKHLTMVQVTNYAVRTRKDGTTFIALELTGNVELVQSINTGKFYATVRKCSMPSTFDEQTAKMLVGSSIEGTVTRVSSEPYDYTVKSTGEVIQLSHTYEYRPVDTSSAIGKRELELA
jgi:hypothetical protein